jgi:hypothetical protein
MLARRVPSYLIIVGFCLFTFAPIALFTAGSRGESIQNRSSAQRPEIDGLVDIFDTDVMAAFDAYLDDALPQREQLVKLDARIDQRLGDSPSLEVVLGSDGWLFSADTVEQKCVEGDALEAFVDEAERASRLVAATGRRLVLALGPDKASVYTGKAPDSAVCSLQTAAAVSRATIAADVVAPWDELRAAAEDEQIYYRLDTHWNPAGAAIFGRELVEMIETGTWVPRSIQVTGTEPHTGDLTNMIGDPADEDAEVLVTVLDGVQTDVSAVRFEAVDGSEWGLTRGRRHVSGPNAPVQARTVLMHDSFGWDVIPVVVPYLSDVITMRHSDPAGLPIEQALSDAQVLVWLSAQRQFYPRLVLEHLAAQLAVAYRQELQPVTLDYRLDGVVGRVPAVAGAGDHYAIIELAPGLTEAVVRVDRVTRTLSPDQPRVGLYIGTGAAFELVSGAVDVTGVTAAAS